MYLDLGARERQIMEALYQTGRATVAEVRASLADPPSYSAVRTMLGKLEVKGLVRHTIDGPRFVYLPTITRRNAQTTALRRVLQKLFNGSAEKTVAALLDVSGPLEHEELDRLEQLIEAKRRERGRPKRR